MTPEEFDATPESAWDDRYRYELIMGVLVVTPPVSEAEVDPNDELGYLLRTYKETHPDGSVLDATTARADASRDRQSSPLRSSDLDRSRTAP